MAPRHVALVAAAVAVFGAVIYLAIAVGREPAPPAYASTPTVTHVAEPDPAASGSAEARPSHQRSGTFGKGATLLKPEIATTVTDPAPAGPAPSLGMDPTAAVANDATQTQANKAYDRGDFEQARTFASQALAQSPGNPKMLRIMVSSNCIEGEGAEAQKYFEMLPANDQQQMRTRCERYGVTFK